MSDDYLIEQKLVEALIGPITEIDRSEPNGVLIWRFSGQRHLAIGGVSYKHGERDMVYCDSSGALFGRFGTGWCLIPGDGRPILWPPCTFAEFIAKLRDPKVRKASGLPKLKED